MRQKILILLSSFLGGILLSPIPVSALDLISPLNGQADVELDAYFQWEEVSGAAKYVLSVDQFQEAQDNILPGPPNPPGVCSAGVCSFGFLQLTVGSIDYASAYNWDIDALDVAGNSIGVSPGWVFTTEQEPIISPPHAQCSDGLDNDSDGDTDHPADLDCSSPDDNDEQGAGSPPGGGGTFKNPISAQNLTELFNKIFSFLFGLAIFIVPVIVIYAAFLMLMGGGDPVKLAKGRMILLWTAIAFTIILLSRGLPVVFQNLL